MFYLSAQEIWHRKLLGFLQNIVFWKTAKYGIKTRVTNTSKTPNWTKRFINVVFLRPTRWQPKVNILSSKELVL